MTNDVNSRADLSRTAFKLRHADFIRHSNLEIRHSPSCLCVPVSLWLASSALQLRRQPHRHFECVGTVVVVADREGLELLDE